MSDDWNVYVAEGPWAKPLDPDRCVQSMKGGSMLYRKQCKNIARKDSRDGRWCGTHDPDRLERKRQKRDEQEREHRKRQRAADERAVVARGLKSATVEQLRAELARRERGA